MAEDFTEDDFEDLPPAPRPTQRVIKSANPPAAVPRKPTAQPVQPVATKDVAEPKDKYALYTIPQRMGIFDNEFQRPVIEEGDVMAVLLSLLVKVANDVEEIKGRL